MEVHHINSYGKDPFTSTGNGYYLKYLPPKPISTDTVFLKQKIQDSRNNGGQI